MIGIEIRILTPLAKDKFNTTWSKEDASFLHLAYLLWHIVKNRPKKIGNELQRKYEVTVRG